MISKYLFGTRAESDWKEGSPIVYRGSWEGKTYEDKGTILRAEPGKVLETTYWSSMSGTEDKPENYARVTYALEPENEGTRLTITQTNNRDEKSRDHSESNWNIVLGKLKQLVETGESE
jgi:uncharacterized protein YndB with AHSA1/START domain